MNPILTKLKNKKIIIGAIIVICGSRTVFLSELWKQRPEVQDANGRPGRHPGYGHGDGNDECRDNGSRRNAGLGNDQDTVRGLQFPRQKGPDPGPDRSGNVPGPGRSGTGQSAGAEANVQKAEAARLDTRRTMERNKTALRQESHCKERRGHFRDQLPLGRGPGLRVEGRRRADQGRP